MFVLCVVSKDKKAKCRTMKTKTQVWIKYRVQENSKKIRDGARFSAPFLTGPETHPASYKMSTHYLYRD
jgi:hypothetical protein